MPNFPATGSQSEILFYATKCPRKRGECEALWMLFGRSGEWSGLHFSSKNAKLLRFLLRRNWTSSGNITSHHPIVLANTRLNLSLSELTFRIVISEGRPELLITQTMASANGSRSRPVDLIMTSGQVWSTTRQTRILRASLEYKRSYKKVLTVAESPAVDDITCYHDVWIIPKFFSFRLRVKLESLLRWKLGQSCWRGVSS